MGGIVSDHYNSSIFKTKQEAVGEEKDLSMTQNLGRFCNFSHP